MYFTTFGSSALLHLLVSHPRIVAVFGLVSTVAMLATPFGPRSFAGAENEAIRLESRIAESAADSSRLAQADRQVQADLAKPRAERVEIVRSVLSACGPQCTNLSVDQVVDQPELLQKVLMLGALDQGWRAGAAAQGHNGSR